MFHFAPDILKVITDCGWNHNREVNIDNCISPLIAEGYTFTELSKQILTSFYGLVISPPKCPLNLFYPSELVFDPLAAAAGEYVRILYWQFNHNRFYSPIGSVLDLNIFLIDHLGECYACSMNFYYLGKNFSEAIELLIKANGNIVPMQ